MKALFLVQLILFLGVSYVTLNGIIDCGTDYSIQNGFANFAVRSTIFQENVPVTCMNGYELYGDEHITCLEDGNWSGNVTCRIKNCKNTFHLEHGHAEFSGDVTPYGGMVPVVCSEGYEIEGDHVITCLADGNWSTSTSCRVKDCGTDYHLENGHVNFTGRPTLINHTVPVLCDDGYYIQGDRYITCLSDGTWSQYTRCRSTSCGIEYKYREKSAQSGLWPSITSRYSTGYCVAPCEIQSYQIRCERTPNFNQSCRIEECDAIFNNAAVANFGFNLDCGTGFKRKKVVHFSEFALIPVNCDIKDCGTRYSLSNGYADFSQSTTTYNATAPVKCDHGYRMAGPAIITCLANGTWSHAACLPIDCGSSYTLEHGAVDFTGIKTTFQHTALVYCDEGYRIQGSSRIACQSDGQWSQSTRCQLISCGTDFVIEHGYANFNTDIDLTYNQSISVTCQIGYIMVGNPNIICQADGNWHGAGECQKLGFQQALKKDLFAGTPTGTAFVDLMSFFPQRKKTDFIAWTTTNTSCVKDYELNDMILKVRHSGYKTLCKLRIMVWELQSTIHDFFVTVEYYGCWPSGDANGTYWKVANLNTTHVKVCPEPYTGTITRRCNDKGTFNEPNYNCTKSKIGNIISELDRYIKSQDILNAETVAKSLQELANATLSNDDGLNNTDVKFTVNLLDKLTGETVVKQTIVHGQMIDIADNLFDVNNTRAWQQLVGDDSYGVENLIDVIEKSTMHIIEDDGDSSEKIGPKVFSKRNLMLSMGSTASCSDTLTFPDRSNPVTDWVKQTSNLVQLHCNSVNASDSFSGAYFKNISKLFSTSAAPFSSSEAMEINSGVMTFTIFPKIQKQLNPEIEIRFQLFNESLSKPTCSFWSEDLRYLSLITALNKLGLSGCTAPVRVKESK